MTRSEKRLILSWAKYRRRFGDGEQERTLPSRFLKEIPSNLVMNMGVEEDDTPQVDLTAERWQVRQESRKNLYTGKTYNSVENVAQFFKERGVNVPMRAATPPPSPPAPVARPVVRPPAIPQTARPVSQPPAQGGLFGNVPVAPVKNLIPPAQVKTILPKAPPPLKQPARTGTVVEHPKYGKGTIVRREGDGDDAKIVVIFQHHGMKKLVEKYAGLKKP
jgi:DNA helicase-2/ATP-dependent DNA helicase PcrA